MFGSRGARTARSIEVDVCNDEARTHRRARKTRNLAIAGLALALTGGVLGTAIASPAVLARQDDATPTPDQAACRTVIQGDQTTSSLIDPAQFVPVSELGEAPATATATATPAPPSVATPRSAAAATPIAGTATATATAGSSSASDIAAAESLRSLAFAVVNCTSQGDFAALGDLVTDNYLSQTFAGGDDLSRSDLLALAAVTVVPQQALIAFENAEVTGDTASAEVIYTSGNQLLHEQWNFTAGEKAGEWLLDGETPLESLAYADSAITNVTIKGSIKTDPREVDSTNVVLLGENKEKVDHEMLVLQLPSGATTDLLLQQPGPGLPSGVKFIGQMTVPAGGEATLPLINLAPGNYVVVCMLLDDNGAPYLADGYKARLIVGS